MNKIEHIGIAVSDLKAAGSLYEKLLNTSVYKTEEVPTEGVTTAFLHNGPNKIELLQASNPDSPVAKFIAKKGEGLHHIAFEVDDIKAEMARLKNEGFVLLSDEPKPGADNKLVCFVHPKSAGGVLIELVQEMVRKSENPLNSMEKLKLIGAMTFKGFVRIEEPFSFNFAKVSFYNFGESTSYFSCPTHQGKTIYIWKFLFDSVVNRLSNSDEVYITNSNAYINRSGFVIPLDRAKSHDKPISFSPKRMITLPAKDFGELKNLGDKIFIVGDDGVIYTCFEFPFHKIVNEYPPNKQALLPQSDKNVVYRLGNISFSYMKNVECVEVFPPFKF